MKKYWAIAFLSFTSYLGFATVAPQLNAQLVPDGNESASSTASPIVELCNSLVESDPTIEPLQCLFDQSTHLNRAKNLARQRGEKDNGGISVIQTEPSMHGPSAESPHQIELAEGRTHYIFTFRIAPRGTDIYTHESQVKVIHINESSDWMIETVYNRQIASTSLSYSEQLVTTDS